MEFRPMPKTPRFSREIVITEKIDGTNASVMIVPVEDGTPMKAVACVDGFHVLAGSRTRWIEMGDDNFGFAAWVQEHAPELVKLGPGHHFGEWWGRGIQRGYGLAERRFSLFNVGRWGPVHGDPEPLCCDVVPVLYRGPFYVVAVDRALGQLVMDGSWAAPGFMDPEGVMIYHTAANQFFKKTLKGDEEGKFAEAHLKKEKSPREPRDPSKGGRRKADLPFDGSDRRKTDVIGKRVESNRKAWPESRIRWVADPASEVLADAVRATEAK